jgi:hypothetical protein
MHLLCALRKESTVRYNRSDKYINALETVTSELLAKQAEVDAAEEKHQLRDNTIYYARCDVRDCISILDNGEPFSQNTADCLKDKLKAIADSLAKA